MNISFLLSAAFLPLFSFILPKGRHFAITITTQLLVAFISIAGVFTAYSGVSLFDSHFGIGGDLNIVPDAISGFFILIINLVCLLTTAYSQGYLAPYFSTKGKTEMALHALSLVWLQVSMILVVTLKDGFGFLASWEAMTISSFILVMFEANKRETFKVGISYLMQMHVGFFFILAGFVMAYGKTKVFGFEALTEYFALNSNVPLFLIFFVGFGLKAGFVPLHTWLPNAHPAAPSHVSAVMSGVMIKMGLYGLVRVLCSIQSSFFEIGIILLSVSLLTSIWGVVSAIVQKDLKKVLAYSSIENIGIVGIGLGLGFLGIHTGFSSLSYCGFAGAILHILNHAIFKPLLFMGAGSVYAATHTRNMNELGGLSHKMPYTTTLFIIGSISICGLPPFNGFISELVIYLGMFQNLAGQSLREIIMLISSSMLLALVGGLAIFAFSKAVGIAFLGAPRKPLDNVKEAGPWMLMPQLVLVLLIVPIGIFPKLFLNAIAPAIDMFPLVGNGQVAVEPMLASLGEVSWISLTFFLGIAVVLFIRSKAQQDVVISQGPTWGCGYTAVGSEQQYTSTSYSDSFVSLAKPIVKVSKEFEPLEECDFFPQQGSFKTGSNDLFEDMVTVHPTNRLAKLIKRAAILQTGYVQHYVLYALLFILSILVLTYFKLL